MSFLKNLLFGSPEERKRKAEAKRRVKEAYWRGYTRGKVERARKEDYRAGKTTTVERVQSGLAKIESAITGAELGASGFLGEDILSLGLKPRKRKTKRKKRKKTKTIVIKV